MHVDYFLLVHLFHLNNTLSSSVCCTRKFSLAITLFYKRIRIPIEPTICEMEHFTAAFMHAWTFLWDNIRPQNTITLIFSAISSFYIQWSAFASSHNPEILIYYQLPVTISTISSKPGKIIKLSTNYITNELLDSDPSIYLFDFHCTYNIISLGTQFYYQSSHFLFRKKYSKSQYRSFHTPCDPIHVAFAHFLVFSSSLILVCEKYYYKNSNYDVYFHISIAANNITSVNMEFRSSMIWLFLLTKWTKTLRLMK